MMKLFQHLANNVVSICLLLLLISCSKDSELLPATIALHSAKGLQVGVAMANITPDDPLGSDLEGYGNHRSATGVHDSLTVRCMVINDGQTVVALVTFDLIGLFMNHIEDIKKMIVKETGLKDENIFIHSIHTHSGPPMLGDDKYNGEYRKKLNRSVTNCLLKAFDTSKNATAFISYGSSTVKTVNRRYPQKPIANKFTTVEFKDTAQNTISMLLNFGCHPVVLGPDNSKMTADYIYFVRKKVETEKGGIALFFNSRFGDINPPPISGITNVYSRDGGTFKMAQVLGEQIAIDMLKANLNCDTIPISIKTSSQRISVPQLKYTDHTHIALLDLGQVQIAMIPGEPVEGFVDEVEAQLTGPYKMAFGQTGDAVGYIIPENQWGTCKNSFISSCYEETLSCDISLAGKLNDGYKKLLEELK
jgi:hypothetical protein